MSNSQPRIRVFAIRDIGSEAFKIPRARGADACRMCVRNFPQAIPCARPPLT
jgi:hypothetical protein